MIHKPDTGDIFESTGFIKSAYLILEIEGKKVHVLNLKSNEVTFVYDNFFKDDELFKWRKV